MTDRRAAAPAPVGPLLNGARLELAGASLRPVEVELYLYHPTRWPDPYVHRHHAQRRPGGWYIHRRGLSFRQGTFKGLDLTAGDGDQTCLGVLLRALETTRGEVIEGPCNCVHHVMRCLHVETLEALSAAIETPSALDVARNPAAIRCLEREPQPRRVYATARVGLNLKRLDRHPAMPHYVAAPLRFTTRPELSKGRALSVIALLGDGMSSSRVAALTRSRETTVKRIEEELNLGRLASRDGDYELDQARRKARLAAFDYGALEAAAARLN